MGKGGQIAAVKEFVPKQSSCVFNRPEEIHCGLYKCLFAGYLGVLVFQICHVSESILDAQRRILDSLIIRSLFKFACSSKRRPSKMILLRPPGWLTAISNNEPEAWPWP
jgi:hypothetical protein